VSVLVKAVVKPGTDMLVEDLVMLELNAMSPEKASFVVRSESSGRLCKKVRSDSEPSVAR
jgi:hypothetical protein